MWRTSRLGWIPGQKHPEDLEYEKITAPVANLPHTVDLRHMCPPVYDQGQLGSCTGNAIAGAIDIERIKLGLNPIYPSRLAIYWGERNMEGTVDQDAGAQIRDGISLVAAQGAGPEQDWPYDPTKFTVQPPPVYYQDAMTDVVTQYSWLDNRNITVLKSCLARGNPFVFGMVVYDQMESDYAAKTGYVELPEPGNQVVGGHAVCCVGYEDHIQRFIVRNSWGHTWGDGGYFWLPYGYMTDVNLVSDCWNLTAIGEKL